MSSLRRRIIRPSLPTPNLPPRQQKLMARRRGRLARERAALQSWLKRLKRACLAVARHERTVVRLERQLALTENS